MANIKITDLNAYTDPASTDVLPIVDVVTDETKKVSIADLMENAGTGSEVAPSIAFDGDANTGVWRPGPDQIAISTGGTKRFEISATGAVTIPGNLTAAAFIPSGSSVPTNGVYLPSSNNVAISSNGTERMRITSDAYVRLASGTGGIQFNGDTAGANALDDYEEGTFTPTLVGLTTAGTGTYSIQNGKYTKIGNRVLFTLRLSWTAHTGTGNMEINGLPFTVSNTNENLAPCSLVAVNVALSANNYPSAQIPGNGTNIALRQNPTGGGAQAFIPMDTDVQLFLIGSYTVD